VGSSKTGSKPGVGRAEHWTFTTVKRVVLQAKPLRVFWGPNRKAPRETRQTHVMTGATEIEVKPSGFVRG
jgi:hypothetical protein